MDLTLNEEQRAITALADRILSDQCGPDALRAAEREKPGSWSRAAWTALAEAGLTGIGLPERFGGGGYGFVETALVVEAVARAAAPLPAYGSLVLGAAPIARFGSDQQQRRWLPAVCDGSIVLSGILTGAEDSDAPVQATRSRDGLRRLTGTGWYVPHALDAAAFVTVVEDEGDDILCVVPADASGVSVTPLAPMSGAPTGIVELADVVVTDDEVLDDSVGSGGAARRWLRDRATAATCVAQVGTCAGALALTARYVSEREQFGVKLATLQAVSQRAADAWIDTELVRLTAWAATWRLAQDLDAHQELSVAKVFAAQAAQRVVAAAQHLHGGIGMDLDYPVHRHFRWAKEHEQRLGGGAEHLVALGRSLAGT